MYRSNQKQEMFRKSAVSAGPHLTNVPVDQSFTDEALQSGGQYDFTVKNNLFELQSRCNSLQYDKYKRAISYIETTNDLQNKTEYLQEINTHLTQQVQALSDERDILRAVLGQVREQNHKFSIQINQLKIEIHKMITKQPSQNHQQGSQSIEMMRTELQQKQRQIQSISEQLKNAQKNKITESVSLQHQNQKQKLQKELTLITKREGQLKMQIQELSRHYKRKQNEQTQRNSKLENQTKQLRQKLQQKQQKTQALKQQHLYLSKQLQQKTSNFRLLQIQRANLENKCNQIQLQLGRLKCQKTNLQQYKSYLQTTNQECEVKRKTLQQQIFKIQSQNSEIREQLFNQKLETKKQVSRLKLQVQQQRIRYQQTLSDKQKESSLLKQQLMHIQIGSKSVGSLSVKSKSQAELEKINQKNSELMAQNEELRRGISDWEAKLEKKHQKYCSLENKLKKQYEDRIKELESQIYKQQQTIGELQYKVQFSKNTRKSQKPNQNNRLVSNWNEEVHQKQKRINQLQKSVAQLENIIQFQQKRISKHQQQQARWQNAMVKQQKLSTISMLEQEIVRLNKELKLSQSNETVRKQQVFIREQKFAKQLAQLQSINKKKTQQIDMMMKKLLVQQDEIILKEIIYSQMRQEVTKMKEEKAAAEAAKKAKEQQIIAVMLNNQQISRNQTTKIRQNAQKESLKEILALNQKLGQLQSQNLTLKEQYSQALQQINILLVKYQNLQQSHGRNKSRVERHSTSRAEHLQHECQRLRICLNREEEQVKRLNQMLAASKSRTANPNQRTNKIAQHLWLGQETFMLSRMSEMTKNYEKQYNRQM